MCSFSVWSHEGGEGPDIGGGGRGQDAQVTLFLTFPMNAVVKNTTKSSACGMTHGKTKDKKIDLKKLKETCPAPWDSMTNRKGAAEQLIYT